MNPNDPKSQQVEQVPYNPVSAMRPGEVVVCSVQRHPIGIIGVYASFAFLLVIVGVVAFAAPDLLQNSNYDAGTIRRIGALVFALAAIFVALFSFVAHIVYFGNRWIVTSDSITQISQDSLFNKQTSQLSLGNLEDVTAVQDGILAHMFNYGVLKAETAGERSKFQFPFCPNPNECAQKILVARENFEQGQWYGDQRPDHRPNVDNPSAPPSTNTPLSA